MGPRMIVRWRGERFRVHPRTDDPACAGLIVDRRSAPPSLEGVRLCLSRLREAGYTRALTSALYAHETTCFLPLGFEARSELVLLERGLAGNLPTVGTDIGLTPLRSRTVPEVLALDQRAFEQPWLLDSDSLKEALEATPRTRARIAVDGSRVVGYAITGVAGGEAFLQRLGVDPDRWSRGIGSTLLADGVGWARRRGAATVLVNTPTDNLRALAFYSALGFDRTSENMAVLCHPDLRAPRSSPPPR